MFHRKYYLYGERLHQLVWGIINFGVDLDLVDFDNKQKLPAGGD